MKHRLLALLVLAAALLVAIGLYSLLANDTDEGVLPDPGDAESSAASGGVEPDLPAGDRPDSRGELDAPPPSDGTAGTEPEERRDEPKILHVRGLVLDVAGDPLAGVPIATRTSPRRALAESDGAGRFELELETRGIRITLVVFAGTFAALRNCDVDPRSPARDAVLVAAPAIDLAGTVVEAAGTGLAEARVTVELRDELLRDFPVALDRARRTYQSVETDESGHFALARVPAVEGALLSVDRRGFEHLLLPLPLDTRDDLVFELRPTDTDRASIEGIVLLPDRSPAPEARVRYTNHEATTGPDGRFSLPCDEDVAEETPLAAAKQGYGTVIVPRFGELVGAFAPYPPPAQTLVLGATPLAIAGTVVNEDGEPQSGWVVRLRGGTEFGGFTFPPDTVESLGGAGGLFATDPDGAFRIPGLLDRDYVLWAHHYDTFENFHSSPIPAGTEDVVLEIPAGAMHERVRGTVVSRNGSPVPDVRVTLHIYMHRREGSSSSKGGASTTTDEAGAFEIADVPVESAYLAVASDDIVPVSYEIGPEDHPEALVVEVAVRRHFRVTASGDHPENAFVQMLDASGQPLPLFVFEASGWSSRDAIPLDGGRTPIHSVSEDAVELRVLAEPWRDGGREVVRRPLVFEPEGVTELDVELR